MLEAENRCSVKKDVIPALRRRWVLGLYVLATLLAFYGCDSRANSGAQAVEFAYNCASCSLQAKPTETPFVPEMPTATGVPTATAVPTQEPMTLPPPAISSDTQSEIVPEVAPTTQSEDKPYIVVPDGDVYEIEIDDTIEAFANDQQKVFRYTHIEGIDPAIRHYYAEVATNPGQDILQLGVEAKVTVVDGLSNTSFVISEIVSVEPVEAKNPRSLVKFGDETITTTDFYDRLAALNDSMNGKEMAIFQTCTANNTMRTFYVGFAEDLP